jgi:hypothetical protein
MYHDYSSQSYYVKAHANRLISEARQARQAQEYRLAAPAKLVSKQKKAFFSSFGTISNSNALVRHDI